MRAPSVGAVLFLLVLLTGAAGTVMTAAAVTAAAVSAAEASATEAITAEQLAPVMPVRVGGNIRVPVKVHDVPPVYPPDAEQAGVQGIVILEIQVDPGGLVTHARVLRGIPLLNDAAVDAVKQWRYEPTLLQGTPVPVLMTVTVSFTRSPSATRAAPTGPASSAAPLRLTGKTGGSAATADTSNPWLLAPGRAGGIGVGMTADELYAQVPREQVRLVAQFPEGFFTPTLEIAVDPGGPPALVAWLSSGPTGGTLRLAPIEVRDERFRTADGLGVGSTFGELRAAEPNLRVSSGESRICAVAPNGYFSFCAERPDDLPASAPPERLDSLRVTRVLLLRR